MAYKPGVVLTTGFAAAPVSIEAIEAGGVAPPTRNSATLIAYARSINLRGGDVQVLLVAGDQPPLDRAKAQYMMFVGKRSSAPWAPGEYRATYAVKRGGRVVITRAFSIQLQADGRYDAAHKSVRRAVQPRPPPRRVSRDALQFSVSLALHGCVALIGRRSWCFAARFLFRPCARGAVRRQVSRCKPAHSPPDAQEKRAAPKDGPQFS